LDAIFRLIEARSNEIRSQPTADSQDGEALGLAGLKLVALPSSGRTSGVVVPRL